jgi:hypothetical protein
MIACFDTPSDPRSRKENSELRTSLGKAEVKLNETKQEFAAASASIEAIAPQVLPPTPPPPPCLPHPDPLCARSVRVRLCGASRPRETRTPRAVASCSRLPQPRWRRAAPSGRTVYHRRPVATARDEQVAFFRSLLLPSPAALAEGRAERSAAALCQRAAAGASRPRETSKSRAVRALRRPSHTREHARTHACKKLTYWHKRKHERTHAHT